MRFRPTLRARLLAAYLIPTMLAMGLMASLAYFIAWGALESSLGERLADVAQGVAVSLRAEDAAFLRPGDEESRTYRRVRESLEVHRDATGARRVVLFDTEGKAIADSDGAYSIGARVADLSRDRLEVERCLTGEATASKVLFTGTDGNRYKTGYAPLLSGDGEVIAGVAVDGSAAFFSVLSGLGRSMVILSLLGLGAVAGVSVMFSRYLSEPVQRLADSAQRIGEGDLGSPVALPERDDEIGRLSHSLEAMRGQLEARQRQLQMMLAGIAHEVRNPLGGMELFTGLLAEDLRGEPEKLAHVNRIKRELGYLSRLVTEFLEYARERPLELEKVFVEALLTGVADLVAPEARDKQVTLRVEDDPSEASGSLDLRADAGLLRRALINLARNAVQASPEGGRVTLKAQGSNEGEVVFSVMDEGPGISPEMRDRVFEPFFTTREKGSGLGLALARKAAEVHGGRISFGSNDSSDQGGALVELRVPMKASPTT